MTDALARVGRTAWHRLPIALGATASVAGGAFGGLDAAATAGIVTFFAAKTADSLAATREP